MRLDPDTDAGAVYKSDRPVPLVSSAWILRSTQVQVQIPQKLMRKKGRKLPGTLVPSAHILLNDHLQCRTY